MTTVIAAVGIAVVIVIVIVTTIATPTVSVRVARVIVSIKGIALFVASGS